MNISKLKSNFYTLPTTKIFSTRGGKLTICTFRQIALYAQMQGIFYWDYSEDHQLPSYFVRLAELMRGERRNKQAALCYRHALETAWDILISGLIYGSGAAHVESLDPYEIYAQARLHLLDVGNQSGLERLKGLHHAKRKELYLQRKMAKRLEEFSFENRVANSFAMIEGRALSIE